MSYKKSQKPRAVFLDAYTLNPGDNPLDCLHELLELEIFDRTEPDQVQERIRNAEIVISNKCRLRSADIESTETLRFIQVAATGFNNIDLDAASRQGIAVSNVSGYSTQSVAQHVFALLLGYLNGSMAYAEESRQKVWSGQPDFSYWKAPILELSGKTMGIFGYGNIGKAVSQIALAFGMHVLVHHRRPMQSERRELEFVSRDQVFSDSDIISLHVPLTDETSQMINRNSLAQMKNSAILVNTGRGGLIHEAELAEALQAKIIRAALLDVLTEEPPPEDHILLGLDNAYITPHQAWASLEARKKLLSLMYDNFKSYVENRRFETLNDIIPRRLES